jgi:hypothetical protein
MNYCFLDSGRYAITIGSVTCWAIVSLLWVCVTGCDWHIILVCGMLLVSVEPLTYWATLFVYWEVLQHGVGTTACCEMNRIFSTRKPDYLYQELQFGRSAWLSYLIVRGHHYATTASSFFVWGAVLWNCLPASVRGESSEGRFRTRNI